MDNINLYLHPLSLYLRYNFPGVLQCRLLPRRSAGFRSAGCRNAGYRTLSTLINVGHFFICVMHIHCFGDGDQKKIVVPLTNTFLS